MYCSSDSVYQKKNQSSRAHGKWHIAVFESSSMLSQNSLIFASHSVKMNKSRFCPMFHYHFLVITCTMIQKRANFLSALQKRYSYFISMYVWRFVQKFLFYSFGERWWFLFFWCWNLETNRIYSVVILILNVRGLFLLLKALIFLQSLDLLFLLWSNAVFQHRQKQSEKNISLAIKIETKYANIFLFYFNGLKMSEQI